MKRLRLRLVINLDNDAFWAEGEDGNGPYLRLNTEEDGPVWTALTDVRTQVGFGFRDGVVRDANGNRVGAWMISKEDEEGD